MQVHCVEIPHCAGGLNLHSMCHLGGHVCSPLHALLFQGAHATLPLQSCRGCLLAESAGPVGGTAAGLATHLTSHAGQRKPA